MRRVGEIAPSPRLTKRGRDNVRAHWVIVALVIAITAMDEKRS
jgi:hypothetical protein